MKPKLFSQYRSVRRKISQSLKSLAFKTSGLGTSLVVQWLRPCLPMQGVRVRPLVRELRSHMPLGQKARNNTVTNSIKTLKMVHILKKKKKNQGCIEQFLFWVQTHFPLDQLFCILSLQPHLESQLFPLPTSLGVL